MMNKEDLIAGIEEMQSVIAMRKTDLRNLGKIKKMFDGTDILGVITSPENLESAVIMCHEHIEGAKKAIKKYKKALKMLEQLEVME